MDERWKLTENLWKSNENRRKLRGKAAHVKWKFGQLCGRVGEMWERDESDSEERRCFGVVFISQQEKQQMKKASFNFSTSLNRFSGGFGWWDGWVWGGKPLTEIFCKENLLQLSSVSLVKPLYKREVFTPFEASYLLFSTSIVWSFYKVSSKVSNILFVSYCWLLGWVP